MVELLRPGKDYMGTLDSLYDSDQPVIQVNNVTIQVSKIYDISPFREGGCKDKTRKNYCLLSNPPAPPSPPPLPDSFLKAILGHFGPFLDPNIAIWFLITHLPPPSLKQLKSSSALVEHYQLW